MGIEATGMRVRNSMKNFPIVCVGGSAGGLDAYIRLLKHLPSNTGVAIVIVNHQRTVATLLHEILPQYTEMPVELITERLDIEPNHDTTILPFVIENLREAWRFRAKRDII